MFVYFPYLSCYDLTQCLIFRMASFWWIFFVIVLEILLLTKCTSSCNWNQTQWYRWSHVTFVLHMIVHFEARSSRQTGAMSHKQADPSLNSPRRPVPDVLQFNKYLLPVYIFCLFLLFPSNESPKQSRIWTFFRNDWNMSCWSMCDISAFGKDKFILLYLLHTNTATGYADPTRNDLNKRLERTCIICF